MKHACTIRVQGGRPVTPFRKTLPRGYQLMSQGQGKGYKNESITNKQNMVQELCESRGGRPGLSVLTSLLVSVDVKIY